MSAPPMTPGKLSDSARHLVLPSGITSTGWPAVRDKCADFGVTFDPWQDGAGRVILSKRDDGSYACSIGGVLMSIPRQVGKTYLIGAIVFALCLLHPGLTVLWTAHRLRTADETFAKMQGFTRRSKIKPYVAKVVLGAGNEEVLFTNGSRILFGARERGFGRGFDDVDVEVFDEAQILGENAIDDMIPAMNTAPNPLAIFIGTPPKPTDPSEFFTGKRKAILAGEDTDSAWIEFGADPGCDPEDREQWAKANPSYPHRTPDNAIRRMHRILGPDSFPREGLGIWDGETGAALDLDRWDALADPDAREAARPSPVVFAVEVSPDRQWGGIYLAGRRPDGAAHLQMVQSGRGTAWLAGRVAELAGKWKPLDVVVRNGSPAMAVVPDLGQNKIEPVILSKPEMAAACGLMVDAVAEDRVRHSAQAVIRVSIEQAKRRKVDESWMWAPKGATDVSPLLGVTAALFKLEQLAAKKPRSGRVY